jgi:hypothetical protein
MLPLSVSFSSCWTRSGLRWQDGTCRDGACQTTPTEVKLLDELPANVARYTVPAAGRRQLEDTSHRCMCAPSWWYCSSGCGVVHIPIAMQLLQHGVGRCKNSEEWDVQAIHENSGRGIQAQRTAMRQQASGGICDNAEEGAIIAVECWNQGGAAHRQIFLV